MAIIQTKTKVGPDPDDTAASPHPRLRINLLASEQAHAGYPGDHHPRSLDIRGPRVMKGSADDLQLLRVGVGAQAARRS